MVVHLSQFLQLAHYAAGSQTHTLSHPPGQLQEFSKDLQNQNVANDQQNSLKQLFFIINRHVRIFHVCNM